MNGLKMFLYCFDILAFNAYFKPHFYNKYFETSLVSSKKFQDNLPIQTISEKQIQCPTCKIYICPRV